MNNIIIVVLSIIFCLFAELLLQKINIGRVIRVRQIIPLFFAPAYAVFMAVAVYFEWDSLFRFQNNTIGLRIIFANLIILGIYLVLKLILMLISKMVFQYNSRIAAAGGMFYEFDEEENTWFLKQEFVNFRAALRVFVWFLTVVTAVYFSSCILLPADSSYLLVLVPVSILIVLTEILCYLNGYTKIEYLTLVYGEDSDAYLFGNYHKLKKVLENLFPEPLLLSYTGNEFSGGKGSHFYIEDLIKSEDEIDNIAGDYFHNLRENDGFFEIDMIKAVNSVLHNQNVLIFNPFYRDQSDYMLLPIIDHLLKDHKILVVVGRDSLKEDIIDWLKEMVSSYNRTGSLFRISDLSETKDNNIDIGVLKFFDIYNQEVIDDHKMFFDRSDYVIVIEPSRMLGTSQMSLSVLASKMNRLHTPVYCFLDHYMEGLSDTLSHVFQINLTNIVASPVPKCVYTVMDWKASGDFRRQQLFQNEMHYLGNGVELAAAALKNQVIDVTWFANEKAPVKDIQWIAKQYYATITKYINRSMHQTTLDDLIHYSSNLWGSEAQKQAFVIAEDEENNLFATIHEYLTRGKDQIFLNVISENYLLRDYMRYNHRLFLTDPKAIAAIAPEYSKTERNVVFQLILEMTIEEIPEERVKHELSMFGYQFDDTSSAIRSLIRKYTDIHEDIVKTIIHKDVNKKFEPIETVFYSIDSEVFDKYFGKTLKNAFFVVEDEKLDYTCIDARLFEHITQLVMTGQLITIEGKLYKVFSVTPNIGCILHRAADQYLERLYYRQIRRYVMGETCGILDSRKVGDVEIVKEQHSFDVFTSGYLSMKDNNDLRTAKVIDLSEDPDISLYNRSYYRKSLLKIVLPETTDNIRFTISMLLQEIFRTLFPYYWQYIAVLSARDPDEEGMLDKYVYTLDGVYDPEAIYIVEDSDMDLGILEAIDTNLIRIFEIMSDYLDWHLVKIKEPPYRDPVPAEIELPEADRVKRNFLQRIARQIQRIMSNDADKQEKKTPKELKKGVEKAKGGKKKPSDSEEKTTDQNKPDTDDGSVPVTAQEQESAAAEESDAAEETGSTKKDDKKESAEKELMAGDLAGLTEDDFIHAEGDDVIESDLLPDDLDLIIRAKLSRYQKECYLKFGFSEIIGKLELENVSKYLTVRGWSNGALAKARARDVLKDTYLDLETVNHCDFCGKPISGVSYERLADGRIRCGECSATAIKTVEEFRELFNHVKVMMEATYNITFSVSIAVRTTDARTIAAADHSVFKPSKEFAARTLGFAQYKNGIYTIYIENGSPRLAAIETIAHELTHIWQFINWNKREIEALYGNGLVKLAVYEGMAVWTSVQTLYVMGETSYAYMLEMMQSSREDVYGIGFNWYREKYGLAKDGDAPAIMPFNQNPPL